MGHVLEEPPATPCAFDEAFLADCPYDPEVLLLDSLLEVDRGASLVRCRMVTDLPLPLTSSQRAHPAHHPRHIAGGLIVHAYYVLGLRYHEGWIGYGTHIHKASFRRLISLARRSRRPAPPRAFGSGISATSCATRSSS
jgi:hypothetical protein